MATKNWDHKSHFSVVWCLMCRPSHLEPDPFFKPFRIISTALSSTAVLLSCIKVKARPWRGRQTTIHTRTICPVWISSDCERKSECIQWINTYSQTFWCETTTLTTASDKEAKRGLSVTHSGRPPGVKSSLCTAERPTGCQIVALLRLSLHAKQD